MKKLGTIMMVILVFSFLQVIFVSTFEVAAQSSLSNLTIVSPQNKAYNSQFLTLNVTIDFAFARIESMSYSIDGSLSCRTSYRVNSEASAILGIQIGLAAMPKYGLDRRLVGYDSRLGSYEISNRFHSGDSTIIHGTQIGLATLPELAEGPHSITVFLEGTLYFPIECHYSEQATVYFTIDRRLSSPSPSPSPDSTSTPAPTPYEEIGFQSTGQYLIAGGTVALASIVIFLGLLVYFIKRK